MTEKKALKLYLILLAALLLCVLAFVVIIDPFFHFHKPLPQLFYVLDNERSQNNGIARHFDYDGMATGTSLMANTKVSKMDRIYDTNGIKAQFSGASFYEIDQNIQVAFANQEQLHTVIRCLDMAYFRDDKDFLRIDLGEFPTYLYDEEPLNDVKYIYNRDVLFERCMPMLLETAAGRQGGITDFDDYGNWMEDAVFGADAVLSDFVMFGPAPCSPGLTEEEAETVRANIRQNVAATALAHPEAEFYCFISPYSAAWWGTMYMDGEFFKAIEAERIVIEELLPVENIRLYSFNLMTGLTTDLNNYKDALHYGEWVNSDILRWMKEGAGLLTQENYEEYLAQEISFYSNFEYNTLFLQMGV